MKKTNIQVSAATQRVTRYAERLRDLIVEAASEGIQLSIPDIEDKAELKKSPNKNAVHYRATMAVPHYHDHPFLGRPTIVHASAVIVSIDGSCIDNDGIVPAASVETTRFVG